MNPARSLALLPLLLLLSACVTINIYFPAAAAEKAADRIIQDVWGESPGEASGSEGAPEAGAEGEPQSALPGTARGWALLDLLVPAAQAASADIDISTPAINRIKRSMQQRHGQLKPHYDSGAVGLTNDGLLAVRNPGAVPLAQRGQVNALVAEENRDRKALYKEIARANGHPEWEDDIRDTFAQRWIANARSGWWYQTAGGQWRQK